MPNPQIYDENITAEERLKIAETNNFVGRVQDLVVIVRRVPTNSKINIHKRFGMGDESEKGDRGQRLEPKGLVMNETLALETAAEVQAEVAATGTLIMSEQKGTVNDQEIILSPGTNLPITGLKEKIVACAEKGIDKVVLSKYQSSPNLLVKKDEYNPSKELTFEDYQVVVPPEIKDKITAH
ncbi:8332_t:CDS:2 [Paraglomus occultum]|uniref:8332_t:CDS:1 n=1 Tax=Paraglomus occultum TaxID=144539 RepID=A0A9N9BCY4_9GLOM|nr:8332_t:CDS:2 [Paraglomus occultum]